MTLFINNLPDQVTQSEILELFTEYGAVRHIFYPTHWKTSQGLGFAFVEMSVKAQEETAKLDLHDLQLMGNRLEIREVSSEETTQNRQLRYLE